MYQDKIVLCGANSYEEKFYMNPDFDNLPQHIKDEFKIMCVLYVHDVGGILTLVFEENGELEFEVTSAEGDPMFDEIVAVTPGFINIRIKDVGDFIQVEIEDNGRGIAAADLPYIFDRFYRADASRNSATGGSGIGLSIVKKIIEDHGGKIWATSKESIGTVMYFVLRKYQEVPYEQSIDH